MVAKRLLSVARLAFSVLVFGFVGYTVINLAQFLSWTKVNVPATSSSKGALAKILWDTGLALLFCVLHTLLCSERASRWTQGCHGVMYRTFYTLSSCLSLMVRPSDDGTAVHNSCVPTRCFDCFQLLIWQWQPVHTYAVWNIDASESSFLWWAFTLTHCASWALIYIGSVVVDLGDLTGIKQVGPYCS